jgi:hypothetical protein
VVIRLYLVNAGPNMLLRPLQAPTNNCAAFNRAIKILCFFSCQKLSQTKSFQASKYAL